jgi:glycosyltransferase involved in cell wall biosynthesis
MLLVVSRLEEYKGLEILFSAIPLIRAQVPNAKLVIVGEGSMRGKMEKLAQSRDDITLVGSTNHAQLVRYYENSAALLSVSSYEAFGMSILEAMGHGCPVISASVGAIPYIIQDMKTGLLLSYPIERSELCDAAVKILTDQRVAELLSINAFELAKREYSADKMIEHLLSIYQLAVDSSRY